MFPKYILCFTKIAENVEGLKIKKIARQEKKIKSKLGALANFAQWLNVGL